MEMKGGQKMDKKTKRQKWNDLVKRVLKEMKKKNPNATLKMALKEAKKIKKLEDELECEEN
jgi:uncharacterized protein (UPF0218 family)